MDFKSHLPVHTHQDGTSFVAGSEYTVGIGGYESVHGDYLTAGINVGRELFVVDAVMRSTTKAEDSAFTSGDLGMQILAVRQDVLASSTDLDGDYASFKVNALGELYVRGNMNLDIEVEEDAAHVSGQKGLMPLAVRNDLHAEMTDADGDYSPLTTDKSGAMRVTVVDPTQSNTEVIDFQTTVALAATASADHDYTVAVGSTLKIDEIIASASGRIKVEILADGAPKLVKFNSTANPNVEWGPEGKLELAAGTVLKITITNLENQAQDVYSTSTGYLI